LVDYKQQETKSLPRISNEVLGLFQRGNLNIPFVIMERMRKHIDNLCRIVTEIPNIGICEAKKIDNTAIYMLLY
jgi:hypothetical protein